MSLTRLPEAPVGIHSKTESDFWGEELPLLMVYNVILCPWLGHIATRLVGRLPTSVEFRLRGSAGGGGGPHVMEPRLESTGTRSHMGRRLRSCVSGLWPRDGVPALHRVRTSDGRWLGEVWVDALPPSDYLRTS